MNSLRIVINGEVHHTRLGGDTAQILVIICFGTLHVRRILETCPHLLAMNVMCKCRFERMALARQDIEIPTGAEVLTL
jgi:hypothetical protein